RRQEHRRGGACESMPGAAVGSERGGEVDQPHRLYRGHRQCFGGQAPASRDRSLRSATEGHHPPLRSASAALSELRRGRAVCSNGGGTGGTRSTVERRAGCKRHPFGGCRRATDQPTREPNNGKTAPHPPQYPRTALPRQELQATVPRLVEEHLQDAREDQEVLI